MLRALGKFNHLIKEPFVTVNAINSAAFSLIYLTI